MNFKIYSETKKLKEVILGNPICFREGELINETTKKYYFTSKTPKKELIIAEYQILANFLRAHNINVYFPNQSKDIPQQLTPRDIGFVIGDTFVVSNMKWQSRQGEIKQIRNILARYQGKILETPSDVILEGGNVIIDDNLIYVGIGLRTTYNAVHFLDQHFGKQYQILPIILSNTEEIIHLDAVFNLLGNNNAIVYKNGLGTIPSKYQFIEVSKEEKDGGACNILSINSHTIIIRNKLERLTNLLRQKGFEVLTVTWDETKKTGTVGPRCATLPLVRD